MWLLVLAALAWVGVHVGIAGTPLRRPLAARLGENGFRGLFSLLSLAAISFLVVAYRRAPYVSVWFAPGWLRWLIVAAMLAAFVLLAGSFMVRNPTAGANAALGDEPRGMLRITRHPMLWSFAIWAGAHIAGRGDLAAILFFGAFLATALAGMPSIDAKVARREPARWPGFAARTSRLPFAAIAAGRNRFVAREIGWAAAAGALAWAVLLAVHPALFGVPALPG